MHEMHLDASSYPMGMYIVILTTNKEVITKRFIKIK